MLKRYHIGRVMQEGVGMPVQPFLSGMIASGAKFQMGVQ